MKVIIVEDEFLAQQELSWLIKEHSQMEIVGTFDDGLDVLKFLQHNRVDAIFLDINIPSLDGVLLAQNISQFAHKPFIVFITAWKEHAVGVTHYRDAAKTGSGLATTADQQHACRDGNA